jgi:hypothetical protein
MSFEAEAMSEAIGIDSYILCRSITEGIAGMQRRTYTYDIEIFRSACNVCDVRVSAKSKVPTPVLQEWLFYVAQPNSFFGTVIAARANG